MRARVLYRTHYQVEEPAYMELLVKLCTSPVQAAYPERVAQKLANEVSSRGKKFNVAAAAYAVDLGHGLGILNENNTWTDKGHLLALHGKIGAGDIETESQLDAVERLTHFRLFLEGDGAALIYIARIALAGRTIPEDRERRLWWLPWNRFAREMFNNMYGEYLATTADIADRIALRKELDRLKVPFAGKTGAHKSFIHLQTMFRMHFLQRTDPAAQREYALGESAAEGLKALVHLIPTVSKLEETVEKGRWSEIAAAVFHVGRGPEITSDALLHVVAQVYGRIAATGVPLCSLSTLVDAVQIHLMTSGLRLLTKDEVVIALTALQKERPKDVRFHVDRRGRLAFVKMSDELAGRLQDGHLS